MTNHYGQDGPPQLHAINAHLTDSDHGLLEHSDDFSHLLNIDKCWCRKIRCTCGNDSLSLLRTDSDTEGWIAGKYSGFERVHISCSECGKSHLLFDDGLHGYNAVVCDDRSQLPANYEQNNETLLKVYKCPCGHHRVRVFAAAVYDCLDPGELDEIPKEQWDDAYGYFCAIAACQNCDAIHQVVSCETA